MRRFLPFLLFLTACPGKTPVQPPALPQVQLPIVSPPPPDSTPALDTHLSYKISFCWTKSPDPEVQQYALYQDDVVVDTVSAESNIASADNLLPAKVYAFYVKAQLYNDNDDLIESDPSNTVRYVLPVMSIDQTSVHFQVPLPENQANTVYHLQFKAQLIDPVWIDTPFTQAGELGSAPLGTTPTGFYRIWVEIKKEDCAQ